MENKEAIYKEALRKQLNGRDLDSPAVQAYLNSYQTLAAYEAMESYSASQNEELRKAFENNKEQLMELATHARDLESTIDELNKEKFELHNKLQTKIADDEQEIERLNGLIEDAHNSGWRRGYSLHTEIGESLQQFKTDNNL